MEEILKQILGKLSNLETDVGEIRKEQQGFRKELQEVRKEQQSMREDISELKYRVNQIDKKTDSILSYVEFLDADLQKHKKAK